ncbi:Protein transporter of the TRAM (translocating chain-associating membrane) superfamily [Phaffia rhodozyma]|uniref:Protein transporter of the TRAM (Translocating chain-associating membrane) superfamily n=1 Tax=Phaffia rhodozyma TaxID=264483 RepID=A0A0F7SJG3_PHARH|nr:Protein transporter of the TRAM (translocating chain-associating membrane) superfamily [Phaffia rhodozyma]
MSLASWSHPFLHISYPTIARNATALATAAAAASAVPSTTATTNFKGYYSSFQSIVQPLYVKGPKDIAVIVSSLAVFIVTREVLMRFILAPLAERWIVHRDVPLELNPDELSKFSTEDRLRLKKAGEREMRTRKKEAVRFAEQGWSLLYYVVYWPFGLSVFLNSSSYRPGHLIPIDFEAIWTSYPQTTLTWEQKAYYLTQLAFWFHQLLILNIEARRKDHYQMLSHHYITIGLVIGSYLTNMTAIGTVILVLLDLADILLSSAKMLKYLGFRLITDITFGLFLVSWLITRQVGLLVVIISIWKDCARLVLGPDGISNRDQLGPWDLPFTSAAHKVFVVLLSVLWVLMCIWFAMICNVAWKVVVGSGAEDTRSDDEGDEELSVDEEDQIVIEVGEVSEKGERDDVGHGTGREVGETINEKTRQSSQELRLRSSGLSRSS